ncbi:hypothetical protein B9Z55_027947 [Caenorhabditis nigoni]|uniref:Uncharacterized protein n=1 Tax=Caenorhabditis nigoni TaxID=1611254 RepID=A0A2G5SDA1_9PELO|nr:hypothetical protein B9Z55_027947 [Caenorhabditis nigoni]
MLLAFLVQGEDTQVLLYSTMVENWEESYEIPRESYLFALSHSYLFFFFSVHHHERWLPSFFNICFIFSDEAL